MEVIRRKRFSVGSFQYKIQDNLRDGLPYPYTEQDGVDYISAMLSADENETFAITIDGKAIGSIGVFRQGNIHRQTAELGYYIAEEYWGKGIMTEAVKQICKYVLKRAILFASTQSRLHTMPHLAGYLKKQVSNMRAH